MAKQDRTYARTAADIEMKYNLGGIQEQNKQQGEKLSQYNQLLSQFAAETNARLKKVEEKLSVYGYYPVGSIHISVDNVNPSALFGGEWELHSEGFLVVGTDEDNTLLQSFDRCYVWRRTK